jgi:site-specific DNA recombinase
MKVAIYSRFSTDQQDRTSIAGQVANCEALADREGFDVVATYQDEGISGNDDNRPNFRAMLDSLSRGEFVGIIADESSRFTRNQAELHRLVAELRYRDQFLVTCDGIDNREESSEIVLAVKGAIDAMESRRIANRTYRSLRERHKDGHSAGGRAYGYISVEDGNYRRREIEPDQAAVVREIFERYANGEGAKTIARDLNERGIPSPGSLWNRSVKRASGWMHTTILGSHTKGTGILRNPLYCGRIVWNRRKAKKLPGTALRIMKPRSADEWIEHQDESLRIVSEALWRKVQDKLAATRARAHHRNKGGRPARYLLSGLLKCASCGGNYVLRDGRAYCCSSHTNGRDSVCSQRRTLKRGKVESTLLEGIKAELLAPEAIKEMAKHVRSLVRSAKKPDTKALEAELTLIERQIGDVIDMLTAVGKSDALTARLSELEARKTAIQDRISADPSRLEVVPDIGAKLGALIESLEKIPENPYRDGGLVDRARKGLRSALGPVRVVEEGEAVYAELDVARCITVGSGGRIRTCDLRVMSPTSCLTAPPRTG